MFIRRGKHPHEIALLTALLVTGAFGTFAFDRSATTASRGLSYPYGQILYATLGLGSLVAIVGIFWPGITGALIERAGLIAVSAMCAGQGAATFVGFGIRGIAYGGIMAAIAGASLWRVMQIRKETREIVAAQRFVTRKRPGGTT